MQTAEKRISKAHSVDEQVRHIEFGSALGTDVADSILGPHMAATFGTRRAGYHRLWFGDAG
jgi:hypothetical protein